MVDVEVELQANVHHGRREFGCLELGPGHRAVGQGFSGHVVTCHQATVTSQEED